MFALATTKPEQCVDVCLGHWGNMWTCATSLAVKWEQCMTELYHPIIFLAARLISPAGGRQQHSKKHLCCQHLSWICNFGIVERFSVSPCMFLSLWLPKRFQERHVKKMNPNPLASRLSDCACVCVFMWRWLFVLAFNFRVSVWGR